MLQGNDLFHKVKTIVSNEYNKEYSEISDSIRLVIHETIDKVNDNCTKLTDEVCKDINNRLELEAKGHNLDINKLKKVIGKLATDIYNIYETNDQPSSSGDNYKYACTRTIMEKLING